jgi:hypothetical protein
MKMRQMSRRESSSLLVLQGWRTDCLISASFSWLYLCLLPPNFLTFVIHPANPLWTAKHFCPHGQGAGRGLVYGLYGVQGI